MTNHPNKGVVGVKKHFSKFWNLHPICGSGEAMHFELGSQDPFRGTKYTSARKRFIFVYTFLGSCGTFL